MGMRSTIARRTYQKLTSRIRRITSNKRDLEEQKQSNLDLKLTIDRLKFELDEQRLRNAGSSVADSRPTSIAGSVGQNLVKNSRKLSNPANIIKSLVAIPMMVKMMTTILKKLIELLRISTTIVNIVLVMHGENSPRIPDEHEHRSRFIEEEEIELQDASTDTTDLTTFKTTDTQTDPVPEPPPVYRPKMEDLQVQTDEPTSSTSSKAKKEEEEEDNSLSLLKLVAGIDPIVLKLAINHITREMINQQHSETRNRPEPGPRTPTKTRRRSRLIIPKNPDPKKTGWAILSSAFQDLSLNGILESLSSSLSLLNPSLHNRLSKEDPNGKALLRRKIRLYTTIIIFLTIIASLILRSSSSSSALSNSGTYKLTNHASSSSSSCILEAIKKSSIDNQDYLLGILSSSSSSPLNTSSPSSNINGPGNPLFMKIIPANSLADLIDFNSVALGKEGFFLNYLKYHFQFFVRLTHFGSHMLWSTVSMYQTNPT
ncbi:hypothetical protein PSTT_13060 [Puccinia striiformis]|uniref:Uncharacterized protein n=1 Tax=Puccinia striiformis TaxID=27350 RepID=A0A2S4UTG1_9BASI|nr:hypothetical protein PSTT_13060 [Puccinia striiformis]